MAQPVVGEMEMHSVANLATLQTHSETFFPFKKAPKPSFWVLPREREVLLSQRAHTPLSLSLSLSLRLLSYVLMGRVSVTISYSFRCLTTETVKYANENSFIENLAASKYSMWAQRGKQM